MMRWCFGSPVSSCYLSPRPRQMSTSTFSNPSKSLEEGNWSTAIHEGPSLRNRSIVYRKAGFGRSVTAPVGLEHGVASSGMPQNAIWLIPQHESKLDVPDVVQNGCGVALHLECRSGNRFAALETGVKAGLDPTQMICTPAHVQPKVLNIDPAMRHAWQGRHSPWCAGS